MSANVKKAIAGVVVLAAAGLVWQFVVRPRLPRYQAWQGVIKEPYRIRNVKKDTSAPHAPEHLFYDHYWRVAPESGQERVVEVPYKVWRTGRAGQRVAKESGKRWPVTLPMTEEDLERALAKGYIKPEEPEDTAAAGTQPGRDAFLEANAQKDGVVVLPSGLQYKILEKGKGASPKATDRVKVHYRGTLSNGKEFDSSYSRGQPAAFAVTGVIKGWTEALQLMKVGGKWELYIPYELAYGKGGRPPTIPPASTLIFQVELLDIVSQ